MLGPEEATSGPLILAARKRSGTSSSILESTASSPRTPYSRSHPDMDGGLNFSKPNANQWSRWTFLKGASNIADPGSLPSLT